MKKKIVLIALSAFSGIILLALILAPVFIKRYAIKHSKELVGRQVFLNQLNVNYLTGKIEVVDFKMFEQNDSEVFVSFDTLLIKLEPFQLFKEALVMDRFYLSGLHANVIQYDSTFNFDDIIEFYNSREDSAVTDTVATDPFQFHLSNIEFSRAGLLFENQSVGDTMVLRDISFFIPYIGWNQSEKSEAGLRFTFREDGYFESAIRVDPLAGNFDADLTIHGLHLEDYREYAAGYANIHTLKGVLNSQLALSGNIHEIEKSVVSGRMEVLDFLMKDNLEKEFLGALKIECRLKSMDYFNSDYKIDSLLITRPYVYFEMDTVTNNFFKIFNIDSESTDTALVVPSTPDLADALKYTVNHIAILDGVMDYRDNLTGAPFDYYLSSIEMSADTILSSSRWVRTYSTMLLNRRGKLVAEVGFNPENPFDISLDYVVTNFQLSDLNIYARHYMGFPILNGDMYYKSKTEIRNNQLKSENKLIIQNAELGDKTGGLYDLPMKLALYILKDRKGVINLDIPVRGDLNDPRVSVGKIVWTTFKNLIIKIATAPFDFLAGFMSVDPKDLKTIEYNYLDTTFTAARQKQIDLLLELEQKKKELDIELIYFNDGEKEKEQIAIEEAGKQFYNSTGKDYQSQKEAFLEYLILHTDSAEVDVVMASKKLIPQAHIDSLATLFERSRWMALEKYLRLVGDSSQIKISTSDVRSPKNVGSLPLFEVKYLIKSEVLDKK